MPQDASKVHDSAKPSIPFVLPDGMSDSDRKLAEKILARCVETSPPDDPLARGVIGPCWTWTLAKVLGYGVLTLRRPKRQRKAHRTLYGLLHGVEQGMHLDHLCRNKACCNPAHLEVVSPSENTVRGLSAKAARTGKCPKCGSDDVFRVKNGKSSFTKCPPCDARRHSTYQRRKMQDEGYVLKNRAKCRAYYYEKTCANWRGYLTPEESAIVDGQHHDQA